MVWTPHLWGFGNRDVTQYIVREGADRATSLKATSAKVLSHPSNTCRPRIWDDIWGIEGSTGITLIEGAWRRALCPAPVNEGLGGIEGLGGPANVSRDSQPEGGQNRQRRARISRDEVNYGQGAPWLDMQRTSRVHWTHQHSLHQQEMREAESFPNPGHTFEVDSDCLAYANNRDNTAPWHMVWSRLHDMGLDREHRLKAWKLLHAALSCGAHKAFLQHVRHGADLQSVLPDAYCSRLGCQQELETLSHMLLLCPAAKRVWEWVRDLFLEAAGGIAPPLTVGVLLGDDQREWQPPQQMQPLWTQVRIATIHRLHEAAVQHRRGVPFTPTSIAAIIMHTLRAAMRRDIDRVDTSITTLAAQVCNSTWLRGRNPIMSAADFQTHWGRAGALYSIFQIDRSTSACQQLSHAASID